MIRSRVCGCAPPALDSNVGVDVSSCVCVCGGDWGVDAGDLLRVLWAGLRCPRGSARLLFCQCSNPWLVHLRFLLGRKGPGIFHRRGGKGLKEAKPAAAWDPGLVPAGPAQ